MRDRREYVVDLGEQGSGVHRVDRGAVVAEEERRDHGDRGRQRDLEPRTGRHDSLITQAAEDRIGLDRGIRVSERRELDAHSIHPVCDAQRAGVEPGLERDGLVADALDAVSLSEHVGLEHDPVESLAHLTVGDAAQQRAEHLCRRADRGLGVVVVHAAHEEGTLRLSHASRVSPGPFHRWCPRRASTPLVRMA